MPKVQLRDVNRPDRILVNTLHLPFELRENKPIYVRQRFGDRKAKGYLITDVLQYEIIEGAPDESGIVYLAKEIPG
jgi:hypothetical protein